MDDGIKRWRHVFKLDPDRMISEQDLTALCQSGTHAIIIGGSSGITYENTVSLLARIRQFTIPCAFEVSSMEAIAPGFDYYFIPTVLNTSQVQWLTGLHHAAIKTFGNQLPWHMMLAEGYIILNPQSTVAQLTHAETQLDDEDVIAYARLAERMFHLPIVYIEYSGLFGDMALVKRVTQSLDHARLFYGGGIDGLEKAREAAKAAHTIVVGNIIYDNIDAALETVKIIEQMC